jgi:hypothetical protein
MMARTQILLDPENHRRARQRAAGLGISLAEYVRRLVARDVGSPSTTVDPADIFDLGDSGSSDVATKKDEYLGHAFTEARKQHGRRSKRR